MKYLIDSCIFFDLFKNQSVARPLLEQRVMEGHNIAIFCLIRYEVLRGYYKSIFKKQMNEEQKERERQRLREFEMLVSTLDTLSSLAPDFIDSAAMLYGETQAAGMTGIPEVDLLLFTVARGEGYILVSHDSTHLSTLASMYGVPFEDWMQPPRE